MSRLVGSLARVRDLTGDVCAERVDLDEDRIRAEIEEFLARASIQGGVVLGRGVDGDDPYLYHLVIDSCAFDLDACVDFIVTASQLRMQQARS